MLYYKSMLVIQKPVKPIFQFPGGNNVGFWQNMGKVEDANFPGGWCWHIVDTNYPTDGITFRIYYIKPPSSGYAYRVRFRFMTTHATQIRFTLCTYKSTSAGVYTDFDATFTVPQQTGGTIAGLHYFDLTLPNHLPNREIRISDVLILPVKL